MEHRRRVCVLCLTVLIVLISALGGCEGRVAPEMESTSANGREVRCVVPVALAERLNTINGLDPV